ncbi:MAG: type II toxin-antitoxin system RelE/ParE family toxin [Proteobacteria bacterium]|nr:type II toxin-antitoxin system RelE/ParE family toxin [Pseudomonadota bacterium]
MSKAVRFLPIARQEFDEAFLWYEAKAPALGASFRTEVGLQISRISERPLQFPMMHADVRRARLRRFPYGLFFKVEADGVLIIACFHASRNPTTWRERV